MCANKHEKITRRAYEGTGGAPGLQNKTEAAAREGREAVEQKTLRRVGCSPEGGASRTRSRGGT